MIRLTDETPPAGIARILLEAIEPVIDSPITDAAIDAAVERAQPVASPWTPAQHEEAKRGRTLGRHLRPEEQDAVLAEIDRVWLQLADANEAHAAADERAEQAGANAVGVRDRLSRVRAAFDSLRNACNATRAPEEVTSRLEAVDRAFGDVPPVAQVSEVESLRAEVARLRAAVAHLKAHVATLPIALAPVPLGDRRPAVTGGECSACHAPPPYHEATCERRTPLQRPPAVVAWESIDAESRMACLAALRSA